MFRARRRNHHLFLLLTLKPVFQAATAFPCSLPSTLAPRGPTKTFNTKCQFVATTSPRPSSRLYESTSSSSSSSGSVSSLRDRLRLHDRFDRWRYLQKLLDEETGAAETNQVLYRALESYCLRCTLNKPSASEGSPELSAKRRAAFDTILQLGAATGALPVLFHDKDGDGSTNDRNDEQVDVLLDLLQQILPDPVEDEDAHKGTWDILIELHGREAVKINERNATAEWKARCLVTRVLLYHEFLVYGLVDEPE